MAAGRNGAQHVGIDLLAAIADDADNNLLPAILAPSLAAIALA
jgi:hypothetical protein